MQYDGGIFGGMLGVEVVKIGKNTYDIY